VIPVVPRVCCPQARFQASRMAWGECGSGDHLPGEVALRIFNGVVSDGGSRWRRSHDAPVPLVRFVAILHKPARAKKKGIASPTSPQN
jgi:hypothetical protein